jgi:5-methylcytosine-specific restriction endonuclease McrA
MPPAQATPQSGHFNVKINNSSLTVAVRSIKELEHLSASSCVFTLLTMNHLLSRDDFRNNTFARDRHQCVLCGAPAVDAHHIMERKTIIMTSEKYPRTYHLPFSEGATDDDRIQADWQGILQHELVITEKLDGENTCIKSNGVYARSHGAVNRNPWARPIWEVWERIGHSLGDLHIFGENMYAIHSIEYGQLSHYFYVFAIRDGARWLSWDETADYAQILDLPLTLVVSRGHFNEKILKNIITEQQRNGSLLGGISEGVVCRTAAGFDNADFTHCVLKYVRENHVQTDEHWARNWKKATLRTTSGHYGYGT